MKLTKRDFAAGIVAGIAPPQIISARARDHPDRHVRAGDRSRRESGGYAIKGAKLA